MLHNAIDKSFNMCTVDGDTSTNDTMILLANGASGVEVKTEEDKAALAGLIEHICIDMARRIASDGEGATHLIVVESYGLPTEHDARLVAKAIAGSTLFKAAVFGRDANWGRIMAAAGYSGADVDPTKADCIIKSSAGEVQVMKDGFGTDFSAWITGVENGPKLVETLVWVMGVVIILNQYFQGMGYPPCARILPHWIHPSELATKMSVWNCSHSIGAALAVIVCGYLMGSLGTNLSADDLGRRYSPQIASRIEGEYRILTFFGEDIRKLKREWKA